MQNENVPAEDREPFMLREKINEMINYGRPLTQTFPRRQRDLADGMREAMQRMYKLSIELEKNYYRKTTAKELDIELEWMRHLVREAANKDCNDRKFAPALSNHQYETWARYNKEIGNLLGGYIKSLDKAKK